jgi:hypothetical protein
MGRDSDENGNSCWSDEFFGTFVIKGDLQVASRRWAIWTLEKFNHFLEVS